MDLKPYVGKRVTLVHNLDEPNAQGHKAEELDGTITVVSPDNSALVLKPRGSTLTVLVEAKNIEPDSITIVVEKPKELKPRVLGELSIANARQHLLQAHGWTLTEINGTDDEKAWNWHNECDHSDLGHIHKSSDEEDED